MLLLTDSSIYKTTENAYAIVSLSTDLLIKILASMDVNKKNRKKVVKVLNQLPNIILVYAYTSAFTDLFITDNKKTYVIVNNRLLSALSNRFLYVKEIDVDKFNNVVLTVYEVDDFIYKEFVNNDLRELIIDNLLKEL